MKRKNKKKFPSMRTKNSLGHRNHRLQAHFAALLQFCFFFIYNQGGKVTAARCTRAKLLTHKNTNALTGLAMNDFLTNQQLIKLNHRRSSYT